MSASASNSIVPTSAAATAADTSGSTQTHALGIFKRPEFLAGIDDFRKHFGQEVRSKTTEGYTFLGLDKPVFGYTPLPQLQPQPQQSHQDKPKLVPTKPAPTGKSQAAAETLLVPNSVPQSSQLMSQATGPVSHSRAARVALKTAATGSRGTQRESESTLDHLMSFIKPSPPPSANTTLHAATMNSATELKPTFVKTVVMSQVQPRLNALALSLPAHIDSLLLPINRLVALQIKLDSLRMQQRPSKQKQKQQYTCERSSPIDKQKKCANDEPIERAKRGSGTLDTRDDHLSTGSRSPADLNHGDHRRADASHTNSRKRSRPDFEFQIRVPKKTRRQVLDAIAATTSNKRLASSYPAPGGSNEVSVEPKRARKGDTTMTNTSTESGTGGGTMHLPQRVHSPPAPKPTRKSHISQVSPTRSGSATRLASEGRSRVAEKSRGSETGGQQPTSHLPESRRVDSAYAVPNSTDHSRTGTDIPPADLEQLKRQSTRLEGFMRSFKHSGDAEHGPKGSKELEMGYYLESLACCLEDFWCRSAFSPSSEMKKKWSTMLELCSHIHRACNTRELSPIRGCAALITASVYYQLSSTTLKVVQESRGSSESSNISKLLDDMGTYEQGSRQLLSAYEVSRQFPQTWKRCLAIHSAHPTYEPRSYPVAKKWPSVAYPVGATSNPMDVANFVRQVGDEWLELNGLALKHSKSQTSA